MKVIITMHKGLVENVANSITGEQIDFTVVGQ